jgi:outer membrane protein
VNWGSWPAVGCAGVGRPVRARADTLESALAYAYANNPQLNSQRALVRATDEGVPTALAGYRPRASVTANAGMQSLSSTIR